MEVSPATGRGGLSSHRPGQRKIPKENTLWPVQKQMRNLMFPAAGTFFFAWAKGHFPLAYGWRDLHGPSPRPVAGETSMGLF